MNSNIWKGRWKQISGEVQKQWGDLTEQELFKIDGDRKKLEGLLQEKYGVAQEDARKKLDAIEKKYCEVATKLE